MLYFMQLCTLKILVCWIFNTENFYQQWSSVETFEEAAKLGYFLKYSVTKSKTDKTCIPYLK